MLSVMKKFTRLLKKQQKTRVLILFVMMIIGAFLEILGVSLMIPLVSAITQPDIIESNKIVKEICMILDLHSYRTFVIACIIALILIFVMKDLFLVAQYYIQARFVYNNRFWTQCQLLNAYMKRPYEYFLYAQSGEIVRVIQTDVGRTYNLLMTLLSFASESIVSLALIVTIFVVDPMMTVFVALMMGLTMLLIAKVVKPILRREGILFQKQYALTNKWLLQAINGIKEVKVGHKEAFFKENFERSGKKAIHAEKWDNVFGSVPRLLIEMVSVCSMLSLIALMIYRGREIETLLPSLGAFVMAAVKLLPSANRIVGALNAIAYYEPDLDQLLKELSELEKGEAQKAAIAENNKKPRHTRKLSLSKEITLKNISYHYPESDSWVLEQTGMSIPVGKSIGIVGASGAGKTTAVDILLGLLAPQEGQVLVDGVDVISAYEEWLTHIGYIPQAIFMLDDTIRSNVAFGIKEGEQSEERLWRALEEAHLDEFVHDLPEGLDTQIGERGVRLSGGQRQRIGIARALYADPELLVFDEATSALDNDTEAAIMESINSLHGKKTLLIIAHRLQTIEGCDMVYRVKDGKIERER